MREQLNDPDANVRNAYRDAIERMEKPTPSSENPEELPDRALILAQIHAFCTGRDKSIAK